MFTASTETDTKPLHRDTSIIQEAEKQAPLKVNSQQKVRIHWEEKQSILRDIYQTKELAPQ